MQLHEMLIIILTGGILIGTPLYIYFRTQMIKSTGEFHKKRILKITAINLVLMISVYLFFLAILLSILYQQEGIISYTNLIVAGITLIVLGICFYGNGIYITSIVIEAFTPLDLKKSKSFNIQDNVIHLFHGPISHTLIYSGYIIIFFLFSIMEKNSNPTTSLLYTMVVCGIITGIMYTIAQSFNGTILYQFITSLSIFVIVITRYGTNIISVFNYSLQTFFFFFLVSFLITSSVYILYMRKRTKSIWYIRST